MKQGGKIPVMKVPMLDFGFISGINEEAYQEAVSQYGPKARESLVVLRNGKGSNSFLPVLLNQYNGILPEGQKVTTIAQFGQAFNTNSDFFRGTYQDTGLILRTDGDSFNSNDYIARKLFGKLDKRGFRATPESPVVLSATDLRLVESKESYGLSFDLSEDAKPIQGENVEQAYGTKAETNNFSVYDSQGIPVPDKKGKFKIWNRDKGVSRVYSSSYQGAVADVELLADSNDGGRVVVGTLSRGKTDAEGVAHLEEEIERIRLKKIESLEAKLATLKNF